AYGPARHRTREAPAVVRRGAGDREVQRGPRPGVPDHRHPGRWGPRTQLPAQAGPQPVPDRDTVALQLPDGPPRDPGADPAQALPTPARRPNALPVAAGLDSGGEPVGPGEVHLYLRHPGCLAMAGLLRDLARHRGMATPGSQVRRE